MAGITQVPAYAHPICRAQLNSGVQIIATGVLGLVLLDQITFQTDPGFSLSTNDIVVPYTGIYYMKGCVKWGANADNLERLARIKNDTSGVIIGQVALSNDNSGAATEVRCWAPVTKGDNIGLYCRQSSGANNTLGSGSDGSNCSLVVEFLGVLP